MPMLDVVCRRAGRAVLARSGGGVCNPYVLELLSPKLKSHLTEISTHARIASIFWIPAVPRFGTPSVSFGKYRAFVHRSLITAEID